MVEGGCEDVYPLGDLRAPGAYDLGPEQAAGGAVRGETQPQFAGTGVVLLVVVGLGLSGERFKARLAGLAFEQSGAGYYKLEDLYDLGAE